MSDPVRYLTSLGQALAVMALYPAGHPSRERAVDASFNQLLQLDRSEGDPQFSFLDGEVIYRRQVVREMAGWEWGIRLVAAGIERLEFQAGLTREEYAGWLEEVHRLMAGEVPDTAEARQLVQRRVRYGTIAVRRVAEAVPSAAGEAPLPPAGGVAGLAVESEAIGWMHGEVQQRGRLPLLEAEAVVRSLSLAMHGESRIRLPLLQLKSFDQYTTTHASNVAVLAMGLAEFLGLSSGEVREFGVAGMLHDLGKVRIPKEILVKPGAFTDEERAIVQRHPVEGARIILEREKRLRVASFVAYEHHIMLNGGGYPALRYPRDCHFASKVVHVCDVYDALCTDRPYREAWPSARALGYIGEKAGTEFDPQLVEAFTLMIREAEQAREPVAGQ